MKLSDFIQTYQTLSNVELPTVHFSGQYFFAGHIFCWSWSCFHVSLLVMFFLLVVDWSCFINEVESKMDNLPDEPNLSLHISCFHDLLISATTIHVGKTKPNKKSKPWMAHMRAKIRTRNLNGTPAANSPNEAMSHNGRTITDIKSKNQRFHTTLCQGQ